MADVSILNLNGTNYSIKDTTARSTANTANGNAQAAQTAAAEAKKTAESAETTANSANSTAQAAQTAAGEAKTAAEDAQTTADSANSTAQSAKNTADSANSTAQAAKTAANNALGRTYDIAYTQNTETITFTQYSE